MLHGLFHTSLEFPKYEHFTAGPARTPCRHRSRRRAGFGKLDHDGGVVEMTVDVRDKKQLEKLVSSMRRISGVRDVERLLN